MNHPDLFTSPRPLLGRSTRSLAAIVFALAGALASTSCKKEDAVPPPLPVVQVVDVTGSNVQMDTEIIGQLDSPQNVQVRARVESFLEKILFTEGEPVKKDDPLFELDRKPFQQRLNAALGLLAEAKATLGKYQADTNRLAPLARVKAIPQQDLDNAVAAVAVGVASVQSAEARVEAARIDLGYCDIRAPVSGLIGAKEVSIGELVGKGEPTLLTTISTLDPIWFYCAVSEVQYLRAEAESARTGKKVAELPVALILANGDVHPAKGRFVFIDRAVDPKTGTLRVRAEFPNTEKLLRPGMFGRIKVDLGVRPDSILVPERAVAELQGKTFVWVIDSENKASQRPVKVGETIGEKVVIAEGLKTGERIVVEGLQKVREGMPVQVVPAAESAKVAQATPGGSANAISAKE